MDITVGTIVIAIIGSGALSSFITGIFAMRARKQDKDNGISDGVKYLLYDNIKTRGREYIADGHIHAEDLQDIVRAWSVYHDELNGNGYLDKIMHDVKALPLAADDED